MTNNDITIICILIFTILFIQWNILSYAYWSSTYISFVNYLLTYIVCNYKSFCIARKLKLKIENWKFQQIEILFFMFFLFAVWFQIYAVHIYFAFIQQTIYLFISDLTVSQSKTVNIISTLLQDSQMFNWNNSTSLFLKVHDWNSKIKCLPTNY